MPEALPWSPRTSLSGRGIKELDSVEAPSGHEGEGEGPIRLSFPGRGTDGSTQVESSSRQ